LLISVSQLLLVIVGHVFDFAREFLALFFDFLIDAFEGAVQATDFLLELGCLPFAGFIVNPDPPFSAGDRSTREHGQSGGARRGGQNGSHQPCPRNR